MLLFFSNIMSLTDISLNLQAPPIFSCFVFFDRFEININR